MFEGCLVESRGLVVSRTQRWSALGSAAFQLMLAALIATIPLLRPQTLTKFLPIAPQLTAPPPPRPPAPLRVETSSAAAAHALSAPAAAAPIASGTRHFSPTPGMPDDSAPTGPITSLQLGPEPTGMPNLGEEHGGPSVPVVRAGPSRSLTVSGGVSQGMLLAPIRPVYPEIARVTHTQGTVVVEATISKAGRVESAHASSGPQLLRQAALDAVTAARYQPYLLSGEPVEVQTTVTVVFKMGE
jgi:protein TonB